MPLLPSEYFGSWYVVTLDNKPRILQSYSETQNTATSVDNKYIQGDIGAHIVNIEPEFYATTVNSPILLIEPNGTFYDVFDILLENLSKVQKPISTSNSSDFNYILQSGSISLSSDSSNITANLESWKAFDDVKNFKTYNPEYEFIARTAKSFDIQFSMFGNDYLVNQGNLSISVSNEKLFYVPGSNNFYGNQTPLYSVNGYRVTGDITLIIKPDQFETLSLYNAQSPGVFSAAKRSVFLKVYHRSNSNNYDRTINLGDFLFQPTVELSISANQVITARISFVTMFRRTSAITY
jgi:hypothetical protein